MLSRLLRRFIYWLKNQSKQPKLLVLDVIIAALTILLMIVIGSAIGEMSYSYNVYDEDSFYWRLQDENYPAMVSMYHSNVAQGKGDAKELQEYYGIAKYFEAAADYKMYEQAGKKELADKALADMEEAYVQMGDFSMMKEKIDATLGLE